LVAAIFSLLSIHAQAQTGQTFNEFNYVLNNGTATITGYVGGSSIMSIPSTVTVSGINYPVTSIAATDPFSISTSLTSVTIPASVTSIESGAWNYYSSLTTITVDSSNLNYSSTKGVLFNKTQTTLL